MNYNAATTIFTWETRSWRHAKKAVSHAKDLGMVSVTKQFFVGKLYSRERLELTKKMDNLFQNKTEKFFISVLCESCSTNYNDTNRDILSILHDQEQFEIVQISSDFQKNHKNIAPAH